MSASPTRGKRVDRPGARFQVQLVAYGSSPWRLPLFLIRGVRATACSSDQPEPCVVRRRRHHAPMALRAGGGDRHRVGRSDHRRRNAREPRSTARSIAGRRRRHRHPHRQRAARLRGRPPGARTRAPGSSTAAFTPRCFPTKRSSTAPPMPSSRATAIWSGRTAVRDCFAGTPAAALRRRPGQRRAVRVGALGSAAPRTATCGRRCRRCAAARSTVRSARSGGPTDRSRGSAASTASCRRSSSCGGSASASSRSPTTTSIRSRSTDLAMARRRSDPTRLHELEALRQERFELMAQLAQLPDDLVFFTQITMEAAEDPEFLEAMKRARIRGALVGVESVTDEGLKDVYKGFNLAGDALVDAAARRSAITACTCSARSSSGCRAIARTRSTPRWRWPSEADVTFAQFVLLTPFPGTIDFEKWAADPRTRQIQGRRRAGHPALADSAAQAAQALHRRIRRCRSRRSARARRARGTASTAGATSGSGRACVKSLREPPGVRAGLEAVSPDVRQHRHRHRQRARRAIGAVGAAASACDLPAAVPGGADARPAGARASRHRRSARSSGPPHAIRRSQAPPQPSSGSEGPRVHPPDRDSGRRHPARARRAATCSPAP